MMQAVTWHTHTRTHTHTLTGAMSSLVISTVAAIQIVVVGISAGVTDLVGDKGPTGVCVCVCVCVCV